MKPKNLPKPLAVVCFCHGYTDLVSYMKRVENYRLVKAGIAFVALEYEGHGLSDGLLGYIPDWQVLVNDVTMFFQHVTSTQFADVPAFLVGESMGGAVAYSVYHRTPRLYRGVILQCPMCKISDDMLPPQWVVDTLISVVGPSGTTTLLGFLPLAPASRKFDAYCYHDPVKRAVLARTPTLYTRNPRLATARELIQVTRHISANLKQFDAPFLVMHGREDQVTDPQLSRQLYQESRSKDKSLRLYDGMWHSLTTGETKENVDRVFGDCIEWILKRV
jgi:alpha-beta hydrolase superfamily lysophospholipase